MKLFFKPGACSLSPHIVMLETGLDFTLVRVDTAAGITEQQEDYRRINPKGKVPALQFDDGTVLTEGVAIVQYLADLKPDRQLLAPTGTLARYQTLEWLSFISSELHKGFSPLFSDAAPDDYKAVLRQQLEEKFAWIDGELKDKQWLSGLHFSAADAYLFTVMRWAKLLKLNIASLSALEGWFQRVAARPSVIEALEAEGLS
ncbi:glutathione transferase GstA [Erwinia sp. 198]|uniref:glutathione transferase GstA n=1 Tax=Erwinia sp. 198 TaxID=2022746 RepID=UPI000F65F6F9|nr:glutathione transferase GstA [Erwinia sp. 198]RRZ90431.1 glutathione transferase GstA [Erwinia sp. 198]